MSLYESTFAQTHTRNSRNFVGKESSRPCRVFIHSVGEGGIFWRSVKLYACVSWRSIGEVVGETRAETSIEKRLLISPLQLPTNFKSRVSLYWMDPCLYARDQLEIPLETIFRNDLSKFEKLFRNFNSGLVLITELRFSWGEKEICRWVGGNETVARESITL